VQPKLYRVKLALAAGIFGGLSLFGAGSEAFAATIPFTGSGTYTNVSSSFTYDGAAPAALLTGSEKTNLGPATFQVVSEVSPSAVACTAPDGTAGTTFNLVQTDAAGAWSNGQLYVTAAGAAAGSQCVSSTTGSNGGSVTYTITGGTGAFAGASGRTLLKFAGQTLAAPGNPPGSNGLFGAGRFTFTGFLTK
jgi:hypothetical protein